MCSLLWQPPALVGSTRSADLKRRVLDEATRKRRQLRQLEALEKDNFHDDPHAAFAHLTAKAKLPAFADGMEGKTVDFCIDPFPSSWFSC